MSLFSLIQGRIPPPQQAQPPMAAPSPGMQQHTMPDGSTMAGPPMNAPVPGMMPPDPNAPPAGAPMPGMISGGQLGFENAYNPLVADTIDDGDEQLVHTGPQGFDAAYNPLYRDNDVLPIPGFLTGTESWLPENKTAAPGTDSDVYSGMSPAAASYLADLRLSNPDSNNDPNWLADAKRVAIQKAAMDEQDRGDRLSGAGQGPDHFYEELAFKAAEAAKERRDARQMANVQQQGNQQMAQMQYHKDIIDADNQRKAVANSAVGQAQDTYAKLLSQADPNQGALWRVPGQGFETVMNTKGPTYDQPNMPGTVYPENWG